MQFTNRQLRKKFTPILGDTHDLYPHAVQMYRDPPLESINLQEFEDLSIERLKVLRLVEEISFRERRGSEQFITELSTKLRKHNLKEYYSRMSSDESTSNEEFQFRRKDHISHFILRLAYCKTEDLKRWFIAQETALFSFRFGIQSNQAKRLFLNYNSMNYDFIPQDEKRSLAGIRLIEQDTDYVKVHFTEALELVRNRRVYLHKGQAYIPVREMDKIISTVFRVDLSRALALTSWALPRLEEDKRLLSILNNLHLQYIGKDYSSKTVTDDQITADAIYPSLTPLFPLCMQHLQEGILKDRHLRHDGRRQYGLFLKGIGLPLEESIKFWRKSFKAVDSEQFDKQYLYNIRHAYGREGGRKNYTPFGCLKIITTNPPRPGDWHGCPFRHWNADSLKNKLQSNGVRSDAQFQIMNLTAQGHYQVACSHYFEAMYSAPMEQFVNHPNQYFEESQAVVSKKRIPVTSKDNSFSTQTQSSTQSSFSQSTQDTQDISSQFQKCEDEEMDVDEINQIFDSLEGSS